MSIIKQIMIAEPKNMMHPLALPDLSIVNVLSMCTLAWVVHFAASAILKSILSRTLPCSTTNIDKSLKSTANSDIDLARFYTSAPLYPYIDSSSNSYTKHSSDCLVSELLPWISYTFAKWSFSIFRNSKVTVFSLSARIVCIFFRTNPKLYNLFQLTLFVRSFSSFYIHQLLQFQFWLFDQAGDLMRFVTYIKLKSFVFFEKAFFYSFLVHAFEFLCETSDFLKVLFYFFL